MAKSLSTNGVIPAQDLYYLLGGKESIKILDATYMMPGGQLSPFQGFLGRRIEGAQFFDIDAVADIESPLPHTLPSPEFFESCVSSMGISNTDHVVVYDQSGMYMASSRAWWMFRVFGHENVYVLEGGLQAWVTRGFSVVNGPADAPAPGEFTAQLRAELVVSRSDILNNMETGAMEILDARPADRFDGRAPEPRPGMRAGHIPRSKNLPFGEMIDMRSRLFLKDDLIDSSLTARGVSKEAKVAVSCGSGVTACTLALAMFKARGQNAAVYDGSWSEWGDETSGLPIEVSA